ncbi:MAG TPA: type VI secretion system lipoprotein TssJ [Polyangia bacterium]|jgi:type VI secretion lipoprotein, VC_A0113 family|nr:type VI secretion system lipoprotein TssJ [Polyangia bacterium]
MLGKWLMPALLAGVALLSCAHTPLPCPTPEPIRVSIRASDRLNPGESGESLATTVRLYQLKDASKLQAASVEQILDNDRAVLGDDLVSVKEITLYPGDVVTPSLDRREGALILAVVSFFRHPSGSAWRVASKLPPPDVGYCHAPAGGEAQAARSALRFGLQDSRVDLQ